MKSLIFSASLAASLLVTVAGKGGKDLQYGWLAEANHQNGSKQAVCDPDYGWLPGPDGSNKCYMLIKGFDSTTCYPSDQYYYGMDWFDAMQCCYYQQAYLAEPTQNGDEDCAAIDSQAEGYGWMDL